MEGEVAECRTRLTSFVASADQRSTVRTKYEVSISLLRDESQLGPALPVKQDGNEVTAASREETHFMSISL